MCFYAGNLLPTNLLAPACTVDGAYCTILGAAFKAVGGAGVVVAGDDGDENEVGTAAEGGRG
jgi:hypothetical protein